MLISREELIGINNLTHLCTGGESPGLKTHKESIEQFFIDKALGEEGRHRQEFVSRNCKEKVARLLGVNADDISFLSSTSEAINLLVYSFEWNSGDNIVVTDLEFPSNTIPWSLLEEQGVEIRVVRNNDWFIDLDAIDQAIDNHTRLVNISHVSYFTGQRMLLKELSDLVHRKKSLLCLDVTHSAGAVPVEASYADFVVASCYKWLMGVHGGGIFYWNRERVPELKIPFVGWNTSKSIPNPTNPGVYEPRKDGRKFTPGNESWISVYILNNALDCLLTIGIDKIENHILDLSGQVWDGLTDLGWNVITPKAPEHRAGNICFTGNDINSINQYLEDNKIVIFGAYGGVNRARVSTHFYNLKSDVDRFLDVLKEFR